jgi:hypothetical protein
LFTVPEEASYVFARRSPQLVLNHPPVSLDLTLSDFHDFRTHEGRCPRTPFWERRRAEPHSLWRSPSLQQRLLRNNLTASHAKVEKSIDNVGDFMEKSSQLSKWCNHRICKFHCNGKYSSLEKKWRITFVKILRGSQMLRGPVSGEMILISQIHKLVIRLDTLHVF